MKYPTGILINTKTGKFHPISFRIAPMPGGADSNQPFQRYKSIGHHTEGFETIGAAQEWMKSEPEKIEITERVWEWDGADIPAMVEWFPESLEIQPVPV